MSAVTAVDCDRCGEPATGWVICWYGCGHDQCDACSDQTAAEARTTGPPPGDLHAP